MVAAIIQTRMTSSRLPGKVMRKVMGRYLLDYLIERLNFCHHIDKIILATTINREDDVIADYAEKKGVSCYRGSENDVLARFYGCAKEFGVHHIVRATSDCPLIDPEICDRLIESYLKEKVDYAHLAPLFAEGLDCEVFSSRALEVVYKNARLKSEREHVTLYMNNNIELFKKIVIENKTDDSKYRFTVDEPEDLEVVTAIIEALYKEGSRPFSSGEIKNYLDNHPEIFSKNSHIIRNEGLLISLKSDGVADNL